jgi:hypothetical protein
MPTPIPIDLSTISQISPDLFDCIRSENPTPPSDAQRYRGAGDSKLLYSSEFYPFRLFSFADPAAYEEYRGHPDFWWSQLPWGVYSDLEWSGIEWTINQYFGFWGQGTIPSWSNQGPVIFHQWLGSLCQDNFGNFEAKVLQVLPVATSNYEIWRVTVRAPLQLDYSGVPYTGFFPPGEANIWTADQPWWASSDWTLVSTGTSTPFVPITILPFPAHSIPRAFCQIPPAGCLADGVTPSLTDGDWAGWGILTFLVWV